MDACWKLHHLHQTIDFRNNSMKIDIKMQAKDSVNIIANAIHQRGMSCQRTVFRVCEEKIRKERENMSIANGQYANMKYHN